MLFFYLILQCLSLTCNADVQGDYKTSLLLAKMIIIERNDASYDLAESLLDDVQPYDESGDVELFKALLHIRKNMQPSETDEILELLNDSADKVNPLALALLFKIYSEPFLLSQPDKEKAELYKDRYQIAYNSSKIAEEFSVVLSTVNKVLNGFKL